jgi:hypothetical protein
MFKKLLIISIAIFLFLPVLTLAGDTNSAAGGHTGSSVSLNNPLTGSASDVTGGIPAIIGKIINAVLGIVGSLALLMFVYGGLLWMTAAGRDEKITQGKNIIIWSTLGLIVIFSSYAVVKLLLTSLAG